MGRNQSVLDIIIKTIKQGDGDKRVVSGLASVKSAGAAVMGAFAALAGTAYAMNQAFDATVGTSVRLADEIRGIQQVSGLTAEESSKLVQLTDDFKVSQEELLKIMQKNGDQYDYSIAGLAGMSDAYLSLKTSEEQTLFMQERFGKNWGAFVELMEQGGDKIRAAGDGISESLIFDQAALDSAREYQAQLDTIGDSWMAYKVAVGNAALPETVSVLQALNAEIEEENGHLIQWEKGWRSLLGPIGAVWNLLDLFPDSLNKSKLSIEQETASRYFQLEAMQQGQEANARDIEISREADAARLQGLASLYATSAGLSDMGLSAEEASAKYSSLIGMMQSLNNATGEQIKLAAFQQLQNDLQKSGNELTKEEAALLKEAGVSMGIFSEQSASNAEAIVELNGQLEEGIITLEQYIAKLEAIPATVETDLIINEPETIPPPGGTPPPGYGPPPGGSSDLSGAAMRGRGVASNGGKRVVIYGNVTVYAQGGVAAALEELGE